MLTIARLRCMIVEPRGHETLSEARSMWCLRSRLSPVRDVMLGCIVAMTAAPLLRRAAPSPAAFRQFAAPPSRPRLAASLPTTLDRLGAATLQPAPSAGLSVRPNSISLSLSSPANTQGVVAAGELYSFADDFFHAVTTFHIGQQGAYLSACAAQRHIG